MVEQHQKTWDYLLLQTHYLKTLLINWTEFVSLQHLVSSMVKCTTNFITGTMQRMNDATVGISMGLPLGPPLCRSHTCQHCGAEVSQFDTHGLSCRKSAGHHHHHSAVNDIHRALVAAHLPSCLDLYHSDGK